MGDFVTSFDKVSLWAFKDIREKKWDLWRLEIKMGDLKKDGRKMGNLKTGDKNIFKDGR